MALVHLPIGPASAVGDDMAPWMEQLSFTPHAIDLGDGPKTVTITAHITDDTGTKTPTAWIERDEANARELGRGKMTLVSGTIQDGIWTREVTFPTSAPVGEWYVLVDYLEDVDGNKNNYFWGTQPKLTVAKTDTTGPAMSEFDFTPKFLNVSAGAQDLVVSVRLTDATGVETPIILVDSDDTSQTAGFGEMTLVSGTTLDGTWERVVTINQTAAPGKWTVKLYPLDDVLGNRSTSFVSHPSKLDVRTIPATAPDAPGSVSAVRGDGSATVTWAPAAANGAEVTDYTVTSNPGAKVCTTSTTSCTVAGLNNGTPYTFKVTATNEVGTSGASAASAAVTPAGSPSSVPKPTATRGDQSATVSWAAASGNGAAVSGYTVASSPGAKTCSTTGTTSCVVPGLTNGSAYTFKVTATNAVGTGAPSPASDPITPAGVPSQIAQPAATAGNGQVTLTWAAPAANGSAITGYTVTRSGGGTSSVSAGQTSTTVTGLTNGTAYTFTVTATNAVGTSTPSAASASVTPLARFTTAGTPTITGVPRVGVRLTASPGSWAPAATYAYQWRRNGNTIYKATSATYVPVAADRGARLSVSVVATKAGYVTGRATSALSNVVATGVLATTKAPSVTGKLKVGKTLKANPGKWNVAGVTYKYQWLRNGKAIPKATGKSYKLTAKSQGAKISVKVTASKAGYKSLAKVSKAKKVS